MARVVAVVNILVPILCSIGKPTSGIFDNQISEWSAENRNNNVLFSCPPWSYCDSAEQTCRCKNLPGDPLICDGNFSAENVNPFILDCYCATYKEIDGLIEVGQCMYNCARYNKNLIDEVYNALPANTSDWNKFMCGSLIDRGLYVVNVMQKKISIHALIHSI